MMHAAQSFKPVSKPLVSPILKGGLVDNSIGRIREELNELELGHVPVSEAIRRASAVEYESCLTLGWCNITANFLALMLASDGASYDGRPIRFLLIPPTLESVFLEDPTTGNLAVNFFYEFKAGQITAVETSSPVPLSNVDPSGAGILLGFNGSPMCCSVMSMISPISLSIVTMTLGPSVSSIHS